MLSQKRRSAPRGEHTQKNASLGEKPISSSISLWGGLLCTHTHTQHLLARESARAGKKRRLLPGPFSTGAAWLLARRSVGMCVSGKINRNAAAETPARSRQSEPRTCRAAPAGALPAKPDRPTLSHTRRAAYAPRTMSRAAPLALLITQLAHLSYLLFSRLNSHFTNLFDIGST
jgi:hypothetical protein